MKFINNTHRYKDKSLFKYSVFKINSDLNKI